MEKIDEIWDFIEDQYSRACENFENGDLRTVIDLVYDIVGNIANLYLLVEKKYFTSDKGKLLSTIQEMYKQEILSEDYSKIFKDKWKVRNLAKYGFFSAQGIEEVKIEKSDVVELFETMKKLFSEFKKYKKKYE